MTTIIPTEAVPPSQAAAIVVDSKYFDHVRKLNDIFTDQIRFADQKAAYMFTFILAFLVSSADGRAAFRLERFASGDPLSSMLSAIYVIAVLATVTCALLAVLPRRLPTTTSMFWGNWPVDRARLVAAHETADPAFLFNEYLTNLDNLSMICRLKYRYVNFAIRALIAAILAYVALLVVQGRMVG